MVPHDVNDVNLWLTSPPLSKMRAGGLTLQDVISVSLKFPAFPACVALPVLFLLPIMFL